MSAGQRLGGGEEFSESERLLVAARRRAGMLAVALVSDPFAAATVDALRSYLQEAPAAVEAWARLCAQPEKVLRARIAEVLASGAGDQVPVTEPFVGRVGRGKSVALKSAIAGVLREGGRLTVIDPRGDSFGGQA
ncbi:hypothetical protein [Streptantibioticus ferralitis]|uniref:Uncharacterized protein n=1 Tax=Streptantibioticus ferralitis TaxID=236510 RepID=A0ABT5Z755_9ACTN|nr:hypothetical protein [Streptantibioticus ferralitis]MDF2259672.1 hypothetical protein [Streptantibioticus ferralitis]